MMSLKPILCLVILSIILLGNEVLTQERIPTLEDVMQGDIEYSDDFIDPFDMTNYDLATGKYTKPKKYLKQEGKVEEEKAEKKEDTVATKPDDDSQVKADKGTQTDPISLERIYYKQFIRTLLDALQPPGGNLPVSETSYLLTLTLKESEREAFRQFVKTPDASMHDINDIIENMIKKIQPLADIYEEPALNFSATFGIEFVLVLQIGCIIVLALVALYLGYHLRMSWWGLFYKVVIICLIISIPWNWISLYKAEVAKQQAEIQKGLPEECRPSEMSWQSTISSWFKGIYSIEKDKCSLHHQKVMIDPLWEVAPFHAITVTLTKFTVEPMGYIGQAFSKFFGGLFEHVPLISTPLVVICAMIIILLILLMCFGYKIKLPFFTGIEPGRMDSRNDREITEQREEIKMLKEENMQLRSLNKDLAIECRRPVENLYAQGDVGSSLWQPNLLRQPQLDMKVTNAGEEPIIPPERLSITPAPKTLSPKTKDDNRNSGNLPKTLLNTPPKEKAPEVEALSSNDSDKLKQEQCIEELSQDVQVESCLEVKTDDELEKYNGIEELKQCSDENKLHSKTVPSGSQTKCSDESDTSNGIQELKQCSDEHKSQSKTVPSDSQPFPPICDAQCSLVLPIECTDGKIPENIG